jgi:hypothetical protein
MARGPMFRECSITASAVFAVAENILPSDVCKLFDFLRFLWAACLTLGFAYLGW